LDTHVGYASQLTANVNNKHSNDMEEELLQILEEVKKGNISPKKARRKLLGLFRVSGSYCDYLSLTLDGMKPEEAARECGLL